MYLFQINQSIKFAGNANHARANYNQSFKGGLNTQEVAGKVIALGTGIGASLMASRCPYVYKPEKDFANKSAEESAQTMDRALTSRDMSDFASMTDENGEFFFNKKQLQEIRMKYIEHTYAIKELIEIETDDGKRRFGSDDVLTLVDTYVKSPAAVKELSGLKDEKDKYIFSADEIKKIADAYEKYPEAVVGLASVKCMQGDYRRFFGNAISDLAETYTKYPDAVTALGRNEQEWFQSDEINILAKAYHDYPEAVTELIKINSESDFLERVYTPPFETKREYKKYDEWRYIAKLAEPYSKHTEGINNILKMKKQDDSGTYRFDIQEVCDIVEEYVKAPDLVNQLLEIKTPDGKHDYFRSFEICKLAQKGPEYLDTIKRLATVTDNRGYAMAFRDMDRLLETYKNYPDAVDKLIKLTVKDGKEEKDVFKIYDIDYFNQLAEWYDKYPDTVLQIINDNFKPGYPTPSAERTVELIKNALNLGE